METIFLVCFIFGALFTAVSVVVGHAHVSVPGADAGHFGHIGHLPHAGNGGHLPAGGNGGQGALHPAGGNGGHAGQVGPGSHGGHSAHAGPGAGHHALDIVRSSAIVALPLFNVSSLLAFLTWFGAAGYLLLRFAAWPLLAAAVGAVAAGAAGAVLIALFLQRVLAGEREMDPRDYRLEGTIARVTAGIPADGVGEIVFSKVGTRRSEGARSLTGRPIAHGTEVVIIEYAHGIALVQSWDELMAERGASGRSPSEDPK